MTITMSVLYEKLSGVYRCKRSRNLFSNYPLRSLLLYTRGPLPVDTVFVAEAGDLRPEELGGGSIVCLGEPDFAYQNIPCDLIIVERVELGDEGDVRTLFNQVQSIYFSLLQWDARMQSITQDSLDLGLLLEEGRRELDFSFIFLNASFKPIAISADLGEGQLIGQGDALLNDILRRGAVEDTDRCPDSRPFEDAHSGQKGLYFNIYYNDSYRGKLLGLCPAGHEITPADYELFDNLCRHVAKMYELYSISSMRTTGYRVMQSVLRALLQNEESSRTDVLEALQGFNWGVNDSYKVYYIPFAEANRLSARAEYIVTLMENCFNTARAGSTQGTVLSDGIAWVANYSRQALVEPEEFARRFHEQLRELHVQVGESALCQDFFSLHGYLEQAALALRFGVREDPRAVVYEFGRYSLDYMLDSALGSFAAVDVVHPSLPILLSYDKENNTEFCKTLRMFIRCKYNVLQASSELFIHRSTFAVRIKRIESLCGIDLEDERTRLHILMSFYILEKMGTQGL